MPMDFISVLNISSLNDATNKVLMSKIYKQLIELNIFKNSNQPNKKAGRRSK